MFAGTVRLQDQLNDSKKLVPDLRYPGSEVPPIPSGYQRFASIPLGENVDTMQSASLEQVGERLERILHPENRQAVPRDLIRTRLVTEPCMVGIWDLDGVAVAYLPSVQKAVEEMEETMGRIISLSGAIRKALAPPNEEDGAPSNIPSRIRSATSL